MKPKIKDGISVLYKKVKSEFEVSFCFNASSKIESFRFTAKAFKCLALFNGETEISAIAKKCCVKVSSLNRITQQLKDVGVLEASAQTLLSTTRFSRQLNFFADFETPRKSRQDMQKRIESGKVVIIGLGGIGSWVAYGLVLAGVRNITLVDPDTVSLSNLNRQALYGVDQLGKKKVNAAKLSLLRVNPQVKIRTVGHGVNGVRSCNKVVTGADLVINCADYPDVDVMNRIVTASCYPKGVNHILCGGYDGHLSFVGPTVTGSSPCWFCYEKSIDRRKKLTGLKHLLVNKSDHEGGNLAPIAAITANIHVLEALKLLAGWCKPRMLGCTAELDFQKLDIVYTTYRKESKCKFCKKV